MKKESVNNRQQQIAEWMFANPDAARRDVVQHFGSVWGVSGRTIERDMYGARMMLHEMVSRQGEEMRAEAVDEVGKRIGKSIATRVEILEICTSIARGEVFEAKDDSGEPISVEVPSFADRVKAMDKICKMQGWDEPIKIDAKIDTSFTVVTFGDGGTMADDLDALTR